MKVIEYLYHTFISDFLDENSIVIDLGGNKGEFTKFIIEKFNSNIYVIEPIPEFYNQIPDHHKIKKFQYCIANQKEVEIFIPENQCPTTYDRNSNNKIICQGITLEKFLKENNISKLDLLKVDIEGAEIEMFETSSDEILKSINQITVEFHDFLWQELKPRVEKIKKRLIKLGFYCIPFSIKNNGDVLFIKKSLINYSKYLFLKYIWRYVLGLKRAIKRIIF